MAVRVRPALSPQPQGAMTTSQKSAVIGTLPDLATWDVPDDGSSPFAPGQAQRQVLLSMLTEDAGAASALPHHVLAKYHPGLQTTVDVPGSVVDISALAAPQAHDTTTAGGVVLCDASRGTRPPGWKGPEVMCDIPDMCSSTTLGDINGEPDRKTDSARASSSTTGNAQDVSVQSSLDSDQDLQEPGILQAESSDDSCDQPGLSDDVDQPPGDSGDGSFPELRTQIADLFTVRMLSGAGAEGRDAAGAAAALLTGSAGEINRSPLVTSRITPRQPLPCGTPGSLGEVLTPRVLIQHGGNPQPALLAVEPPADANARVAFRSVATAEAPGPDRCPLRSSSRSLPVRVSRAQLEKLEEHRDELARRLDDQEEAAAARRRRQEAEVTWLEQRCRDLLAELQTSHQAEEVMKQELELMQAVTDGTKLLHAMDNPKMMDGLLRGSEYAESAPPRVRASLSMVPEEEEHSASDNASARSPSPAQRSDPSHRPPVSPGDRASTSSVSPPSAARSVSSSPVVVVASPAVSVVCNADEVRRRESPPVGHGVAALGAELDELSDLVGRLGTLMHDPQEEAEPTSPASAALSRALANVNKASFGVTAQPAAKLPA